MSMLMMVKAMNTKVGNPLRKLVLIKLCDNANDHGECWPSHQHIADQCEISKSSVKNHIKKLSEMGFLSIENREGPKGNTSNLYQITLAPMAGDDLGGGANADLGGAGDDLGGGAGDDPRTSHSFEPVKETLDWSATQMSESEIKEIKQLRKNAKSSVTQRVINQLSKQFELSRNRGYSNADILNEWSIKGWRAYKDEWMKVPPTIKAKPAKQEYDHEAARQAEIEAIRSQFK